jgi:deferrochelatase/peroxidase EfeB
MRQEGILHPRAKAQKLRYLSPHETRLGIIQEVVPDSFSIIFLRASKSASSDQVGKTLKALWEMYMNIRDGQTYDLGDWSGPKSETLLVNIAYGKRFFRLPGMDENNRAPWEFIELPDFNRPRRNKRTPIWKGSGIFYSDVGDNRADADIIFRFLSDKESDTKRTVIETWKYLYDLERSGEPVSLNISGYYTGFLRPDRRNMLDFLDGISNLSHDEREDSVFRNYRDPRFKKRGTAQINDNSSTYMAYIRILIDLLKWRNLNRRVQQEIIGRDQITGCPLSDITGDRNNQCPTSNSDDVLDDKADNLKFRSSPTYYAPPLSLSHVGRTRRNSNQQIKILRQGYNFVEENHTYPFFRAGLNFVSFQNRPQHIHQILTDPTWMGRVSMGGNRNLQTLLDGVFTAEAATVAFVPQFKKREKFPGSSFLI